MQALERADKKLLTGGVEEGRLRGLMAAARWVLTKYTKKKETWIG